MKNNIFTAQSPLNNITIMIKLKQRSSDEVSSFQCLFTIPVFTYGKERTTKNLELQILSPEPVGPSFGSAATATAGPVSADNTQQH